MALSTALPPTALVHSRRGPRGQPLHRDLASALRLLDAVDRPYAEVWRELGVIAATLGHPRPSYSPVPRFLIAERHRKLQRMALVNAVLDDSFRGIAPWSILRALG